MERLNKGPDPARAIGSAPISGNDDQERKIDEQLEQTFPASDPPSYSQPGNDGKHDEHQQTGGDTGAHAVERPSDNSEHSEEINIEEGQSRSEADSYANRARGTIEVKPSGLEGFRK